ncbi:hypothetical protein [Pseudoalteromonas denitrificans]|uniref:Mor transcription activator family protein n=1 Tax=Pseudoalteromonas denitrificans DSM 6059 TaxID=1123010 RepID=A0A1I1FYR0_9GAMM|nr:hypothetical protein [Pseudoalteromonas denitrificans]SFC04421.1 hypothetical protein SAMN02745724_00742 [Pseudoalteromonas denitrificans DSM 6059]
MTDEVAGELDLRALPYGLRPIVQHLGVEKAISVLTKEQGQVMYIPEFPNEAHEVVKLFSLSLVKEWSQQYGQGPYQVPMLAKVLIQIRNKEICAALDENRATKLGLTRRFGITRQQIANIYNEHLAETSSQQQQIGLI